MMPKSATQTEIQIGPQGHLVIPAPLRRLLSVEPGDTLLARLEEGRLILEKPETVKRRPRDRFAHLPANTSLAGELLAERHEEAMREADSE
jgi:bifunctional DNA-binding transcriptional regulator/antitoxin component of YhaV-PrlF toxin-antitoxin module